MDEFIEQETDKVKAAESDPNKQAGYPNLHRGNPAWVKGVAVNPGGLLKHDREFRLKAKEMGVKFLDELKAIAEDENTKLKMKVDIMKWVIEQGFGRPVPAIHVEAESVENKIMVVMDR